MSYLVDPAELSIDDTYRLVSGVVVPRPIAWITTIGESGSVNLAPFSAYTILANRPCLLGITMSKREGRWKDTMTNLQRNGQLVINIPRWSDLDDVHRSAMDHPSDVSEVEHLGLNVAPSSRVDVPRLTDSPVSLECEVDQILDMGTDGSQFVVARVLQMALAENLVRNGKIETAELDPLGRIAGPTYVRMSELRSARAAGSEPRRSTGRG